MRDVRIAALVPCAGLLTVAAAVYALRSMRRARHRPRFIVATAHALA